ncbi:MAG: hypothetical protein IPO08_21655 [Xanthomonadales bacterium]|nr:hypothetical protein [Xanthomonadales bacterium]
MSELDDMRRTLVQAKTRITVLQAQVEDARHETRMACERADASLAKLDIAQESARALAVSVARVLGLVAAFGRFAFTSSKPRTQRHADTWRDKGPHESSGAAARRLRQMDQQRSKQPL